MKPTLNDIRREGLQALRDRLGRAGMLRFLQQFENGAGDYAASRRAWTDKTSLAALKRAAAKRSKPPARRSRRSAA